MPTGSDVNRVTRALQRILTEHGLKLKLLENYKETWDAINSYIPEDENKIEVLDALVYLANYKKNKSALNFYDKIRQMLKKKRIQPPVPSKKKFDKVDDDEYNQLTKKEKARYAYNKFMNDPDKRFRIRALDYTRKLNSGVIENPKKSTLEKYRITIVNGKYTINWYVPRKRVFITKGQEIRTTKKKRSQSHFDDPEIAP